MSPRRDLGPWPTALLALFGITLPGVIFLVPIPRQLGLFFILIPALALLACGFTLYLKFISILKDGVQNQRWTEEQLRSLRRVFESPYCIAVDISLLVAYATFELFVPHRRYIAWLCFLLMMALTQLTAAVRRPRPSTPSSLPNWRDLSPIHSDRWGQR